MSTAFIFPGQGSQYAGMARALCQEHPLAQETFQEADQALGFALSEMILNGSDEDLRRTEITQPAIFTVSMAYHRVLLKMGHEADFFAGHSLGEYTALVAAGALDFSTACTLTHQRGRLMQVACPEGVGAMAALMVQEPAQAERLRDEVLKNHAQEVLEISAYNSPQQIVLAGSRALVEEATQRAADFGIRRATLLSVSAPFHCALMEKARLGMEKILRIDMFRAPQKPYIANADGLPNRTVERVIPLLLEQICAPVRWQQSVNQLLQLGVRNFVEVGPGRVLCGLVKRIATDPTIHIQASDLDSGLAAMEIS